MLGHGGQGTVARVVDTTTGAVRALKLMRVVGLGDTTLERMRREARLLAQVTHPGLVRCHEFFERYADGTAGLVMDLVEGRTLGDLSADPRMTPEHRWAALRGVADALAHLHARGLVHRDVKEDNVLVSDRFHDDPTAPGAVKLVDFGIAVEAGNPDGITQVGGFIGTLPYVAPEVLEPLPRVDPDTPRRDVFAFGVMAFQLLHGRHPTELPPRSAVWDFVQAYRAVARTGWRDDLHPLLRACLAVDPAARPADAGALSALLPRALGATTARTAPHMSTVPQTAEKPGGSTESAEPLPAGSTPAPPTPRPASAPRTPPVAQARSGGSGVGCVVAGVLAALASGVGLVGVGGLVLFAVRDRGPAPAPTRALPTPTSPPPTVAPPSQPAEVCDCARFHGAGITMPFASRRPGSCDLRVEASSYTVHPWAVELVAGGALTSRQGRAPQVCFGRTDCYDATGQPSTSGFAISEASLKKGGQAFWVRDASGVTVATGVLPWYNLPATQQTLCKGFLAPVRGGIVKQVSLAFAPQKRPRPASR